MGNMENINAKGRGTPIVRFSVIFSNRRIRTFDKTSGVACDGAWVPPFSMGWIIRTSTLSPRFTSLWLCSGHVVNGMSVGGTGQMRWLRNRIDMEMAHGEDEEAA